MDGKIILGKSAGGRESGGQEDRGTWVVQPERFRLLPDGIVRY